ncbi:putative leucine-rich repeat domain superfamily, F-box-like domain superfamily [Helianthus annuus]|nr:putative leucine-rich repeat domain superfamily, F-box-like domain superfamily [Helianthus annuus]KAJ0842506.1 putative leucine-rich repeat domain superfamily, F-box-like domain superfamily [Helianthus annuus]KAJ0856146.1 putative leucine-rich repeat domain superfamily, F-box-like domain superfamily [Helianthus annuus]
MIRGKQPKVKAKCLSKVERVDRITTLPQAVVETILCLLPIKEAARTSVLSREWRYKWTTIPELEFYQDDLKESSDGSETSDLERARNNMDTRCKLIYVIHQVLLLHQGPIREFTLSMDAHHTCFEIDQIILHLSRNHAVKKLRFEFYDYNTYGLPLSFFSLHHLTDLYLANCNINQKPIFNGFGSLTNLSLIFVKISRKALLHLLSNCPSLKRLDMLIRDFLGDEKPNIMELFKCLPMIERLTTGGDIIPSLVQASVSQELPASLIHLKYCYIEDLSFKDGYGLPFIAALIKCSPNLEKIELAMNDDEIKSVLLDEYSVTLEKYSNVWLEHLNELQIRYFTHVKPVLELTKFILARSPNLKKVSLLTNEVVDKNERLEMLKTLRRSTRATGGNCCTLSIASNPNDGFPLEETF